MSSCLFFFFKQKTAYEMRISDWSSDVCSSDLDGKERRSDNFDLVTGQRPNTGRLGISDAYWNSFEGSAARTFGAHALALGLSYAGYSDDNRTHTTSDWLRASVTGLRAASGGKTRLLGAFVEDAISLTPHLTATLRKSGGEGKRG